MYSVGFLRNELSRPPTLLMHHHIQFIDEKFERGWSRVTGLTSIFNARRQAWKS
jgi:hypothetical protein